MGFCIAASKHFEKAEVAWGNWKAIFYVRFFSSNA